MRVSHLAVLALIVGASGPTSVALPASECSRSMELAGRELDWRHQRHLWGQLHLPDHAARRSE
jgi:hypothetical protein